MAFDHLTVRFDVSDKMLLVIGTDDAGRIKHFLPFDDSNAPAEVGTLVGPMLKEMTRVMVLRVECVHVEEPQHYSGGDPTGLRA